jgi:hypothetical protein
MKVLIRRRDEDIFCMANVRGRYVKVPHPLKFSFFFSPKVGHGIRVKPVFNPDKITRDTVGNLWIHGAYKYTRSKVDKHVTEDQANEMKQFFRDYKVLFAAVWESVLDQNDLLYYFNGSLSFKDMLTRFADYESHKDDLKDVNDCKSLETYVRESEWFNMND